jgi:predicted transcriptional regulator
MKTWRVLAVLGCVLTGVALAGPEVGKPLAEVRLADDAGGLVTGGAWTSDSMRGKARAVFYVDPDEKDLNEHVAQAIQQAGLDREFYGSVAIINMAATWMPNMAINRSLQSKQKKYPHTVYVKDVDKALVARWGLTDDSYDVILLDAEGVVRFYASGKLTEAQTETVVRLLTEMVAAGKAAAAK